MGVMENIKKLILEQTSNTSAEEVYEAMSKDVMGELDVDLVSIWYFSKNCDILTCKYSLDRSREHDLTGITFSKNDLPIYFTDLIESVSIKSDDVNSSPKLKELRDIYYKKYGIISALDYIIYAGERPIGILCCETTSKQRFWQEQDIDYIRVLTVMAGAELKNT